MFIIGENMYAGCYAIGSEGEKVTVTGRTFISNSEAIAFCLGIATTLLPKEKVDYLEKELIENDHGSTQLPDGKALILTIRVV